MSEAVVVNRTREPIDHFQLGVITPVLSRFPGMHADWEAEATIEHVRRIAQAAESHGYDYITCSEHIAISAEGQSGGCYWDPLPTFGYLAAFTSQLRFTVTVLVMPYHHPLDIVKRYGTLDQICEGRLNLGVGVGYLKGEFDAIGAPFDDRGPRSDDAIRALRASFGQVRPVYKGEFYEYRDIVVDPCGVQQHLPIWVGGQSRRSLRRAVELGDAWVPFATSADDIAEWLGRATATDAWHARERPLEVIIPGPRPVDPIDDPVGALAMVRSFRDAGATGTQLRYVHNSLEHYLEQLEAMSELIKKL